MLFLVAQITALGSGPTARNAEKGEQALLEREVWGVRQPALPHPSKGHLILGSRVLE